MRSIDGTLTVDLTFEGWTLDEQAEAGRAIRDAAYEAIVKAGKRLLDEHPDKGELNVTATTTTRATRGEASVDDDPRPTVIRGPAVSNEKIRHVPIEEAERAQREGRSVPLGNTFIDPRDLVEVVLADALRDACYADEAGLVPIFRRVAGLVRAIHDDPHPFMFSSEDGECGVCGDGIGAHTHYLDADMETCRPVDEDERTDYAERNQCDEAWDELTRPRMNTAGMVAGNDPQPVLVDRLMELVRTLGYDVERFRVSDRNVAGALYQSQADLAEVLRALRWATQRHPDDVVLDKIAERMIHAYPRSID